MWRGHVFVIDFLALGTSYCCQFLASSYVRMSLKERKRERDREREKESNRERGRERRTDKRDTERERQSERQK